MLSLLSLNAPSLSLLLSPISFVYPHRTHFPKSRPRRTHFPVSSISNNNNPFPFNGSRQQPNQENQQPRTLFPGGYKRPDIKIPNFVLQLDSEEVLAGGNVLDLIDDAVSKWVGIVVLNGAQSTAGRVYEASLLLKSVVRDRAYLLIAERVDIAAAINASGVVLSDQGLPAIVARNMMMDSKFGSVVLPLVARSVQSSDAATNASNAEGADFLIYGVGEEKHIIPYRSIFSNVKIPIFTIFDARGEDKDTSMARASTLLKTGASGLAISLKELGLLGGDVLNKLFNTGYTVNSREQDQLERSNKINLPDADNSSHLQKEVAGFIKLEDREKQFIERERSVLQEAISVIQKASPLMEEISLLIDATSQLDEPFLLVIVGEFNSGKSSVINALLGQRYLKEGVIPTTNEITLLRYSELDSGEQQRCERHPDGQYICYLPAPILKEMNIVDTPGTNVILQRQQRLTEEFVPRADLLLFVISADRPLTESEVAFLRYTQQWKKKLVFVLNKLDLYQNADELEEAISFIKENTKKLLCTEHVTLFPISARAALEVKLSSSSDGTNGESSVTDSRWRSCRFYELEHFLYSFLDSSTSAGMERVKLKLETPIGITERLLSACDTLVKQDCEYAKQDFALVNEIVESVKEFALKMETESISWRRQTLSLIDTTKSQVLKLIESTLQLSNLDLVASYIFKGGKSSTMPAISRIKNDTIVPALSQTQKLLEEYVIWLQSSNARQGRMYRESLAKRWPLLVYQNSQVQLDSYELLNGIDKVSIKVLDSFSASAASKLFEQEIREVFLGTFGGLGAAGLSASLLTSVLPTTLEDLLALGLCSTGGLLAISNFPARRQKMVDKVNRTADALARELEEAMQKDLLESIGNLENFVKTVSKPYQDAAKHRLDTFLEVQSDLSNVDKKVRTLQIGIQNLHIS